MMKFPKSVYIAGKKYAVCISKKYAGSFNGEKLLITIGDKYPKDMLVAFLHECFEAICAERGYRYRFYPSCDNNTQFVFNHNEFNNIMSDFALAIKDIVKESAK